MAQNRADAGTATDTGTTPTDFDEADDLLGRLFDLCSPEQKLRGRTPREALARLSPAERAHLLARLAPDLREAMRHLIGR